MTTQADPPSELPEDASAGDAPSVLETPSDPPPPEPVRKSGPGFLAPLAGGALAAVLGFGLSHFDVLGLRQTTDPGLAPQISALQDRTAAIEATAKGTADRTREMDAALASVADAANRQSADLAALSQRLDQAEARLADMAALPAADGTVTGASVAALAASVEAVKSELQTLRAAPASDAAIKTVVDAALKDWQEAQSAKLKADADALQRKAARQSALISLQGALQTGAPYADAIAAFNGDALPDVLTAHAETGLPGQDTLATSFAPAARAALDASLRAAAGDSWTARAFTFLRIQTGARSLEPHEGTDPDAVLSRAEAAVAAGDLPKAVSELAGLPPEGQAQMTAWIDQAKLHIEARDALAALAASVGN